MPLVFAIAALFADVWVPLGLLFAFAFVAGGIAFLAPGAPSKRIVIVALIAAALAGPYWYAHKLPPGLIVMAWAWPIASFFTVLAFARHWPWVVRLVDSSGPRSWTDRLKGCLGGRHLRWSQSLFPKQVSDYPKLYESAILIVGMLAAALFFFGFIRNLVYLAHLFEPSTHQSKDLKLALIGPMTEN